MKALTRLLSVTILTAIAALGAQSAASAHEERPTRPLAGTGTVPTYRTSGPTLLVCKTDPADFATRIAGFPVELKAANEALWQQCQTDGYRHLQAAVDAAQLPGTIIKMLPGLYLEEPSLAPATGECKAVEDNATRGKVYGYPVLTWDQQLACPHLGNLVAILGKRNLQIEGTGANPLDVLVDAQYQKLNAIRADNADGIYFRNLSAQRSQFNAFYVMETDGFVLDHTLGRWNDEYAFLTFAVDHGLYTDCEGYGNGDSAIYPGAASNINKDRGHDVPRYAVEIQRCYGHHNTLGYSGTAGDSVWVHDSVFTENTAGIATDSAFPDHPGMPQNHSKFERNVIAHNNVDYYGHIVDGTCKKPFEQRGYEQGVVCPAVGLPVGTGVVNPGGNYNIWRENWIYDNHYSGFVTSFVPGFVRNDTSFAAQFDTSHHNRYLDNRMGVSEKGESQPNGLNFWWDGQGVGSCWTQMSDTNIRTLPACGDDDLPAIGAHRYLGEPGNTLKMYACAAYDQGRQHLPVDCDWFGAYAAAGLGRIEVKWALGGALVLGLLAIGLYYRRLRASRRALLGLLLAVAGLTVGVFGTIDTGSVLHPIGLALYGAGFALLGLALRATGTRRLGTTTLIVAALALLGAIDHGLIMIPYLPVSPALLRVLTEFAWIPWALGAVVIGRRATVTSPTPEPTPTTT
ncbi:right-handed parallel beta-helix repeat-containing protein [Catellatospora sp. KI3]|uniref:right-handed parallel beta-helix repeat-containing protein n=1 Tax=Catellatospora sp. KI3 TaxID=3041620 RepID=UPI0024831B05|nr:right-handed parallel beta-helix repeat-containing protein [Catellatospora sp. KI3]MDI1459614.1 right-handed parallel beta-helix repeat-containing protein [Catellatospora sp. KI3]